MALATFFLGLLLGLGLLVWRSLYYERKARKMARKIADALHVEPSADSLPAFTQLQRSLDRTDWERQAAEARRQLWEKLARVAPVGYIQVDEDNQLVWCNERAKEILDIRRWQEDRPCLLLKVVRSYELDRTIERAREKHQPLVAEWVYHPTCESEEALRQQRSLYLRAIAQPLDNECVGVFIENRQEIYALSQAHSRWVSDLAHELKTPLTSIRLVVEALHDDLDVPQQELLDRMLVELERLIQLVRDWLELGQMEDETGSNLNYQPVDLLALLQEVWQNLEPIATQKHLAFACEGSESLWVSGDRSRLHRVFLNLLDNSIRYSPAGGRICAALTPATVAGEFGAQIDIIDEGRGFRETDLPHVFDRLYCGDPSRQRSLENGNGNGLGLAIVQQIVRAHGGRVTARNHPQTGGAWLQVRLRCQPTSLLCIEKD